MSMKPQELVDRAYARAQASNFGCGEPEQSLKINDTYGKPHGPDTIALTLVNAFHSKYDLVAIIQGLIETLQEQPNE